MTPKTTKYQPGDRVIALRWPRGGAGVIVKPAPANPLVRWDGAEKDERVRADDIRPETADDVANREHEQAMRAWRDAEPEHKVASVHRDYYSNSKETGAVTLSARTPAEMRLAARELEALAAWFEKRPAAPEAP